MQAAITFIVVFFLIFVLLGKVSETETETVSTPYGSTTTTTDAFGNKTQCRTIIVGQTVSTRCD